MKRYCLVCRYEGPCTTCPRCVQKSAGIHYRYVRALQNNGPNYFLVFRGAKTFGAVPVCSCDYEEEAERIVNALNKAEGV
jgi:hypothetical protein